MVSVVNEEILSWAIDELHLRFAAIKVEGRTSASFALEPHQKSDGLIFLLRRNLLRRETDPARRRVSAETTPVAQSETNSLGNVEAAPAAFY